MVYNEVVRQCLVAGEARESQTCRCACSHDPDTQSGKWNEATARTTPPVTSGEALGMANDPDLMTDDDERGRRMRTSGGGRNSRIWMPKVRQRRAQNWDGRSDLRGGCRSKFVRR